MSLLRAPHSRRQAFVRAVVALAMAGVAGSCQNGVTGPSLTANLQNVALKPTVQGVEGAANLCCCHVAGQITNTSTIAVDAELVFTAKGADGQAVGTAIQQLSDIGPGVTQPFEAVGIPAACSQVSLAQVLADKSVRLRGLWTP